MRRVTRCGSCCMGAVVTPIGFTSRETLVCTRMGGVEVEPDDGCTWGEKGPLGTASDHVDVDLSSTPPNQREWWLYDI